VSHWFQSCHVYQGVFLEGGKGLLRISNDPEEAVGAQDGRAGRAADGACAGAGLSIGAAPPISTSAPPGDTRSLGRVLVSRPPPAPPPGLAAAAFLGVPHCSRGSGRSDTRMANVPR
jgi:hypothetical protein